MSAILIDRDYQGIVLLIIPTARMWFISQTWFLVWFAVQGVEARTHSSPTIGPSGCGSPRRFAAKF